MTSPSTLREVLVERARVDPERVGYDDGRRQITYGELFTAASRQAAALADAGVGPRDRVALVLPAGIDFIEAFWAVQLLGAVPCAFNPTVPARTLERRIALIRPRTVVTTAVPAGAGPGSAVPVPANPGITPDDLAYFQPTSGTSGEPRAAMLRHRNVLSYLEVDHGNGSARRDDVLVGWVPPWHDLGLVRFVIGGVYYGALCHIVEPAISTIPRWLETISRVRGTITGAPDFAYRLAMRMVDPANVDLSSLRFATNGGEPVRRSTIEGFERRFGLGEVIVPGYGLAEGVLGITTHAPGVPLAVDEHGNVGCGTTIPRVELRLAGDGSAPGEIVVRSPFVFAGYFDAPEETGRTLRDGWMHTGDIGYVDSDGNLFVLGRERAMIKRAGAVVAARELEEAAQEVDGVRVAAAVSLPATTGLTETITVVVEAGDSADREGVAAGVSQAIVASAGFAPGQVVVVPPRTVPLTANGKLRHDKLRAMLLDGSIGSPTAEAGRV